MHSGMRASLRSGLTFLGCMCSTGPIEPLFRECEWIGKGSSTDRDNSLRIDRATYMPIPTPLSSKLGLQRMEEQRVGPNKSKTNPELCKRNPIVDVAVLMLR
jgi:hypothetical protein